MKPASLTRHGCGSLSYRVPGVSLDSLGAFRGVAYFAIRGLGITAR